MWHLVLESACQGAVCICPPLFSLDAALQPFKCWSPAWLPTMQFGNAVALTSSYEPLLVQDGQTDQPHYTKTSLSAYKPLLVCAGDGQVQGTGNLSIH